MTIFTPICYIGQINYPFKQTNEQEMFPKDKTEKKHQLKNTFKKLAIDMKYISVLKV